jgi:uncharacterized protein (DUF427 family)
MAVCAEFVFCGIGGSSEWLVASQISPVLPLTPTIAVHPTIRLLTRGTCLAKALWNGAVIAQSDRSVMMEGNVYFPNDSLKQEYLRPSETHTVCPWKGTASYRHLEVDGTRNLDAAWYYPEPSAAAQEIKKHVAFWKGVRIEK